MENRKKQQEASRTTVSPQFRAFGERYFDRPDLFARECIRWREGEGLSGYQEELLVRTYHERRIAVTGPHGLGKTASAAILTHWFALTREALEMDWKMPTTASAWRQLAKFLWPEIHKWSRALKWDLIGRSPYSERTELLTLSLRLKYGEAFAMASDQETAIEGAHADHILFLFDEAKAIPDKTWDAAEGALSTASRDDDPRVREALAVAISTPGVAQGRFFEIHSRREGLEDWWTRHVTREEAIAAGRMSEAWADARKAQWGEHSQLYRNRVLGEFAENDPESLIPLEWVEAANQRWEDWLDAGEPGVLTEIGIDVGGGGEEADRSVFAYLVDGRVVSRLREIPHGSQITATMECANEAALALAYGTQVAMVDATGIGAGVLARLVEMGRAAWGFVSQRRTLLTNRTGDFGFANWRAAGWYLLSEFLHPDSGLEIALPPDDVLTYELTAPHWKMTNTGVLVEAKSEVRKRLGRSTDRADAVIYAIVGPLLVAEHLEQLMDAEGEYDPLPIADW